MSIKNITVSKPARWITEINNGKVVMVQQIESDSFVVSISDFPDICANSELISDEQARLIVNAIKSR